jgi:type VI secretion system protein ImpB
MAESFQKEIPPARINITLDVETNGARKKKELPLKLLVAGDFSNGKSKGTIAERERININKNNFNQIISDLAPEFKCSVPNKIKNDTSEMQVQLKIDSLQKFHPEHVAQQIPELRNLLAMRNLLKDLKANVLDNHEFRRALEKLVKNKTEIKQIQATLALGVNYDRN